jgi:hypothetical protein
VHRVGDIGAAIASGSYRTLGMIIAPCSVRSMSEIATGVTSSLLTRAADVTLKERRPLVLMVRETPLHLGHLRTLTKLAEMGAVIAPPLPAFYAKPRSIAEMVDQSVGRALDLFGLSWRPVKRWGEDIATITGESLKGPGGLTEMRLWQWALEVYARPSVAGACLRCRTPTARTCPICCGPPGGPARAAPPISNRPPRLVKRWDAEVGSPLRAVRRAIKPAWPGIDDGAREDFRNAIKDGRAAGREGADGKPGGAQRRAGPALAVRRPDGGRGGLRRPAAEAALRVFPKALS